MTGGDIPQCYSYLRFSRPEQLKGDSQRRQLELSQKWAAANGYTLDENLSMADLGLSAYRGTHRTRGALAGFLKAVDEGRIAPGSILLVESLDRLSREQVMDALDQFTSIINKGVEIVTVSDGIRYSREAIKENWTQLIVSLSIMARAHEESEMKSKRYKALWDNKRANLKTKKASTIGKTWMKYNKKNDEFDLIPEHAAVVRRIFKMCNDGMGVHKIGKVLNSEGIKTFKHGKQWHVGPLQRLLRDRACIGEYQPKIAVDKNGVRKFKPHGEAVKDYYPAAVSDEVFHAAQLKMQQRTQKGGRPSEKLNLFRYLLKCGYCGKSAGVVNNGQHLRYAKCSDQKFGHSCSATPWPLGDFETAFLQECAELDVAAILPNGNGRAKKINAAQQAMDAVKGEITANDKLISNAEKILDTTDSEAVLARYTEKLDNALAEKEALEKRLTDATMTLQSAQSETQSTDQQLKSLQDLIAKLENTKGGDLIQLRDRLKNAIAQLVERIDIFSDGLQDRILTGDAFSGPEWQRVGDVIQHYENIDGDHSALIDELAAYQAQNTGKASRAFLIRFRAGGFRLVRREGNGWVNTIGTLEALLSHAA